MPAVSKAQQQFFGMISAAQKGDKPMSELSPPARKAARTMTPEQVDEFAKTRYRGLPKYAAKGVRYVFTNFKDVERANAINVSRLRVQKAISRIKKTDIHGIIDLQHRKNKSGVSGVKNLKAYRNKYASLHLKYAKSKNKSKNKSVAGAAALGAGIGVAADGGIRTLEELHRLNKLRKGWQKGGPFNLLPRDVWSAAAAKSSTQKFVKSSLGHVMGAKKFWPAALIGGGLAASLAKRHNKYSWIKH